MKKNNFLLPIFILTTVLVLGNASLYYSGNYNSVCNLFGTCKTLDQTTQQEDMTEEIDQPIEEKTRSLHLEEKPMVYEINNLEEFKNIFKEKNMFVIDFHSQHCPACVMAKKSLPEIAHQFTGKVTFYTVDIAAHQDIVSYATESSRFKEPLEVIPTFVYYVNAMPIEQTKGFKTASDFIATTKAVFNI